MIRPAITVSAMKPKTTAKNAGSPKEQEKPLDDARTTGQPKRIPPSQMTEQRQLIINKILRSPISDSYEILGLNPSATLEQIQARYEMVSNLNAQLNLSKSNHILRYLKS